VETARVKPAGARCEDCPAGKDGGPGALVPPVSHAGAKLVIIGESPSKSDIIRRKPFSGSAGQCLAKSILAAGLAGVPAHKTLGILCQVSQNDAPVAAQCCAGRLALELAGLPADVPIVALGTISERTMTGHGNIRKGRGFIWRVPEWVKQSRPKALKPQILHDSKKAIRQALGGRVVFPALDPGWIVHGAETWGGLLTLDLRRVKRWLDAGGLRLEDAGPFTVCKTPAEFAIELSDIGGQRWGKEVVVDVETTGKDPMTTGLLMVGLCDVASMRVVQAYPWSPPMAGILDAFLAKHTAVTHNGPAFDEIVLEQHGVTYAKREDTLIAHHAYASHLRQSLDHCASNYTDSAPWKLRYKGQTADDKGGFGVSGEDLPVYNCADVRLDALVWKRMQADLEPERGVYRLDMRLADVARRMRLRGIKVDIGRKEALSAAMREREERLHGELKRLTGKAGFSPTQAAAIREVLYGSAEGEAGIRATRFTPTGAPATNRSVLEALRGQDTFAGRFANLVLEWRRVRDSRTEYLDNLVVGDDGRLHAGWKSAGPETGRPACREPNLLNMPRIPHCAGCGIALLDGAAHSERCSNREAILPEGQIRDIYVAGPGKRFVYFDLSQAEMRFAAHISGDKRMIEACRRDVHAGNAMVLWPEHAELIAADPKGRGKPFRDIAKNVGFAIAYLAKADTVYGYLRSKGFPVRLRDVKKMLARLHVAYKSYYDYVAKNVAEVERVGYMRSVWSRRIRWMGWHPNPPMVANYPIQSGVADRMNECILALDKAMPWAGLVMYAYDALVFEVDAGKRVDECQKRIIDYWAKPIRVPGGVEFVQPIDTHVGERLSDF
jgi:DNA polymerase I-like protein with 3'-5' exonuclease and polymerase domains/uracil-DNA glycosylase